jgi:hypothetical protein
MKRQCCVGTTGHTDPCLWRYSWNQVQALEQELTKRDIKLKLQAKELRLQRELENIVRFGHGRTYKRVPKREESKVLTALEKMRNGS